MSEIEEAIPAGHDAYRADLAHYWSRLMWYREELWRITTPVWMAYGAFIAACVGFVWPTDKGQVSGPVALMLIFVIMLFSWVIFRVYWIYAHCIYTAIKYLNGEIREREQHIYNVIIDKKQWTANYSCFRVYPKLNVLFSIVGVAMMAASMFMVAASVEFNFETKPLVQAAQQEVKPVPELTEKSKTAAKAVTKPAPAPMKTAPVATTPAPATAASISPLSMAGICFALFLFFEFMLWILHWRDRCEDGRNHPFTVKGEIQVDLKN